MPGSHCVAIDLRSYQFRDGLVQASRAYLEIVKVRLANPPRAFEDSRADDGDAQELVEMLAGSQSDVGGLIEKGFSQLVWAVRFR